MHAPVLYAVDELGPPMRVGLERAQLLAEAAGATLHVVRVVGGVDALGSSLVELFNAERELRRELRDALPEALGADRLRVCGGDFVREVCASVSRDRAQLVVLMDTAAAARRAARIARQTRAPVLVARASRPSGAVLGTTALEHRRYAVIKKAHQVASWLEAPLVVLHSLPAVADDGHAVTSCSEHLQAVAREHAPGAAVVVGRHEHPVEAILDGETRYGCDVLVVGARVGTPATLEPCTAESVVRGARSSVLVTPME